MNPDQLSIFKSSLAVIAMYVQGVPQEDLSDVRLALKNILTELDTRVLNDAGTDGDY